MVIIEIRTARKTPPLLAFRGREKGQSVAGAITLPRSGTINLQFYPRLWAILTAQDSGSCIISMHFVKEGGINMPFVRESPT